MMAAEKDAADSKQLLRAYKQIDQKLRLDLSGKGMQNAFCRHLLFSCCEKGQTVHSV
jgi:hypothetical protein